MEKQFTIETRLELQEDAVKYLTEYVVFYNEISRKLWQIVRLSNLKSFIQEVNLIHMLVINIIS